MSSRSHLAQIAAETLDILDRGEYVAPAGARIDVAAALEYARSHSVHYTPEMFAEVFRRRAALLAAAPRHTTTFKVVNCTTLGGGPKVVGAGAGR